jgi:hypothetical protein
MPESPCAVKCSGQPTGKFVLLGLLAFVFGLLSSCTFASQAEPLSTLIPEEQLPTVIAMTANAMVSQTALYQPTSTKTPRPSPTQTTAPTTAGPSPTVTITDTQTLTITETKPPNDTPTITLTPTETPTPTKTASPTLTLTSTPDYTATSIPPDVIPFAAVQIIHPGHLSKVVSPIDLYTFVIPGGDERIRVELTGEDGRLLYRQIFLYTDTPAGARVHLKTSVTFEIPGVAETARLTVSVNDEHEQLKSLSSVDLVLLAEGQEELNPTGDLLENIFIQQPTIKSLVQGDSVLVTGLVRTGNNQPLLVELVTANGRVIGNRLAGIAPLQEDGGHRIFAAEVPFSVRSPTWVRVTVYDNSGRIPGPKHVSSVEVLLSP